MLRISAKHGNIRTNSKSKGNEYAEENCDWFYDAGQPTTSRLLLSVTKAGVAVAANRLLESDEDHEASCSGRGNAVAGDLCSGD